MANPGHPDRSRFAHFELDPTTGELFSNGKALGLQPQPSRLLQILVSRAGDLVTREELRQALWADGTTVDFDQALNYSIRQIRAALGESAGEPTYIETLPKRGYRFIAPLIEPQNPQIAASAAPLDNPTVASKPSFGWKGYLAAAVMLVVASSIYLLARKSSNPPGLLLVRPFIALGLSSDEAWYGDAITQQLIGELARTRKIKVLPWSTSLGLKNKTGSVKELRERYHADSILEGSIRRDGNKLEVVTQLVDARSERILWSHRDQRETTSLGDIETNILASIAETLNFRFTAQDLPASRRKPPDSDTYNLYLRASSMKDQLSRKGALDAVKGFEEVIRRAPDFALAHAGLANTLATLPFLTSVDTAQTLHKAVESARRAIALDPSLAEAHSSLAHAYFNQWKWREAEQEFQIALSLDPDSASTLQIYALYLASQRRFEEALLKAKAAAKLAPTSGLMAYTIAMIDFYAGKYDEAITASRQILALDRGFSNAHSILGRAYAMNGMREESFQYLTDWDRSATDRMVHLWRAHRQAMNGEKGAALESLKNWEAGAKQPRPSRPITYAIVLLECGELDRGFSELHKAIESRRLGAIWFKSTPELKKWQNDPRYLAAAALFDNPSN